MSITETKADPSTAVIDTRISAASPAKLPGFLPLRIQILVCILGVEFVAGSLLPHPSINVFSLGPAFVVFGGVLLFLGRQRLAVGKPDNAAIGVTFAALHGLLLMAFAWIQISWPRSVQTVGGLSPISESTWLIWAVLLLATLLGAAFPGQRQWEILRRIGMVWVYAAVAAVAAVVSTVLLQMAWNRPGFWLGVALQKAAFAGVLFLLRFFYTAVVSDPSQVTLGTAKFQVAVNGGCSGIEGLGLMLVLTVGWLVYARRELRLERAWLLVPLTLATVWALNLIRITALIAIGDAGHEAIAVRGFHSEAGWILFNLVALAFLLAANHLRWLHKDAAADIDSSQTQDRNVAMIYLLPFFAVLATSMIGRAASSGFDWMYPLRLVVAVAILWWFRDEYRKLDWRFGWLGPLAGVAIFAMWFLLARWQHLGAASELGTDLERLAPWQRVGWIVARAIAAVVTVPIAEELAFRGYIARRFVSADVETVSFARLTLFAMVASSLLFGLMHGRMWVAGAIAGMAFAIVAKMRGRLGEAVAAHAVANLLIAAWVMTTHDFGMW